MEHYKSYFIRLHLLDTHYIPFLTITGKNETVFFGKKTSKAEINNPESEINILKPERKSLETSIIIGKKNQLALF
jgi:hypothetical protein